MTDEAEDRENTDSEDQSEHEAPRGSDDRRTSAAPPTEAIILKSSD